MIKEMLIAGCGGFVGTCCRYLTVKLGTLVPLGSFPVGTFAVNAVGCLLIGLLCGLTEREGVITHAQNVLLVTGFCGGFTTFSTFANDIFNLGVKGDMVTSAIYLVLSVVVGIACVWLGRLIAA